MITFCKYFLRQVMLLHYIQLSSPLRILKVSFFAVSTLLFSSFTYAQEVTANQDQSVSQEYNANKPVLKDDFEWQFALDFSLVYDPTIIAGIEQNEFLHYFMPGLLFDISYKGFFLQTNQRRSNALLGGTEFGYQVVVEDNWQLDVIAKAYMQGYDPESEIKYSGGDEVLLGGLKERNATLGIALRYSRYFENSLFTLDLAATTSGDDEFEKSVRGLIIDSFYSYLLPYRNWDIYFGTGLTYFSQDIVDYYIGVSSSEITETRAEYAAKGGFRGQAEIYVQHPLSASWSFNAGITHSLFSSNVKASPLVDTNHVTQVMLGVLYVF